MTGDNGMSEYNNRANRKIRSDPQATLKKIEDGFRIYFPTAETVASSRGGNAVWTLQSLTLFCNANTIFQGWRDDMRAV